MYLLLYHPHTNTPCHPHALSFLDKKSRMMMVSKFLIVLPNSQKFLLFKCSLHSPPPSYFSHHPHPVPLLPNNSHVFMDGTLDQPQNMAGENYRAQDNDECCSFLFKQISQFTKYKNITICDGLRILSVRVEIFIQKIRMKSNFK